MWYPMSVQKSPPVLPPKPPLFVKQLPKPTHPSPKPPKQYNDFSRPLNLGMKKIKFTPQGFLKKNYMFINK
jgi:hypothetical protein